MLESEKPSGYLVAVVVPVTRMAGKLEKLESWLRSIESDWQVVIVHDYRDEGTSKELKVIINSIENENIILTEGQFGNPGDARNSAIDKIKSRWCIFWDSDDYGHVSIVAEWIRNNPTTSSDIAVFRFSTSLSEIQQIRTISRAWGSNSHKNLISWGNEPGLWRCLIRSGIIQEVRFPPTSMGEDQAFLSQLVSKCKSVEFSNEIAYTYFIGNPLQLTNSKINLEDLRITRQKLSTINHFTNSELTYFTQTMWWKISGTMLLKAPLIEKLNIFFELTKRIFIHPKEWTLVFAILGARICR